MSEMLEQPVTLEIGGREWKLRYRLSSCRRIDEVSGRGKSVMQGALWGEEINPSALALLLWGALLVDQPEVTLDQVEDMVHPLQWAEVHEAICKAWIAGRKPKQEEAAPPPTAPTPSP